jgi:hypothetical protein
MTGLDDVKNAGKISEWNGMKTLNHWNDKYWNMINGSDGMFFPPIDSKNQIMYLFSNNICR